MQKLHYYALMFFLMLTTKGITTSQETEKRAYVEEVAEFSHLFLIDPEMRRIGLVNEKIDGKPCLMLPTTEVAHSELSNYAITRWIKNKLGMELNPEAFSLIATFYFIPKEKNWFQGMSDSFQSLFTSSRRSNPSGETSLQRLTFRYYGLEGDSFKANSRLTWISIPELYAAENKTGAKQIGPVESLEILKLITKFRNGEEMLTDYQNDYASIKKKLKEKGVRVSGDISIPLKYAGEYYERIHAKEVMVPKSKGTSSEVKEAVFP